MKVDTLKLASKSPGIDSKATEAKLGEAQAVLDTINRSCNDEVDAIKAEEQKQIDALHKAAAAKVDQALEAYTAEQNDRIRRGAKTARDETIAEIYPIVPSAQVGAKVSETTGRPVGKSANLRVSESKSLGTDDLQRRIVLLNTRIRADLSRAVAKFAREKGVAVTFTRSSDRVPDQTQVYYELLREHPLSEAGLVLSDTRGI